MFTDYQHATLLLAELPSHRQPSIEVNSSIKPKEDKRDVDIKNIDLAAEQFFRFLEGKKKKKT